MVAIASDCALILDDLQSFVLHDPDSLQLYRLYLSQSPKPQLVNHIDFLQDALAVERFIHTRESTGLVGDEFLTYQELYSKYFTENNPQQLLCIKKEIIDSLRANIKSVCTPLIFQPALFAVIKDLCFEHFHSFIDSDIFEEFKEYLCVSDEEIMSLPKKERNTALRLRRFFGEKVNKEELSKVAFRAQPHHVKTFKLSKRFGERVAVEREETMSIQENKAEPSASESSAPMSAEEIQQRRRTRRLHVFFGDFFSIEDVLFSEKVRAPFADDIEPLTEEDKDISKQPEHVNTHRLNRFFGERVNSMTFPNVQELTDSDKLTDEEETIELDEECIICEETELPMCPSRFAKTQRIIRFFGERIDPSKEASSKSFADQPAHVKPLKLKKIFGTPVTINSSTAGDGDDVSGPTKQTKRAHKLHKFFGTKIDEDGLPHIENTPVAI